jgi:vacuolar-type H+-ATPase subunit E/Vma4
VLLLAFPDLKKESGAVKDSLKSLGVSEEVLNSWRELVAEEIRPIDDEEEFDSFTSD